jgi:segregation and condensation protein B
LQNTEKKAPSTEEGEVQEERQGEERKQNDLALVEAALYVAGRPLDLNELCSVLRSRSKNKARKLAQTLTKDYAKRNTALEILELKDERYVLQLRADFTPHVKRPLLSAGPLKTLSYIAFRQPVPQKRVIDVRGHHAYGHIKMLREMNLVNSERSGRSTFLRTTDYFADYFALSHDTGAMKRELRQTFEGELEQAKPETSNG